MGTPDQHEMGLSDDELIQIGADPRLFDETHRRKLLRIMQHDRESDIPPTNTPRTPQDVTATFSALFGKQRNPRLVP